VGPAVAGLGRQFVGLDGLDDGGLGRVRLGVDDVDARRAQAGDDEVPAFGVFMVMAGVVVVPA
jgi:hypothetical protein